MRFCRRRCTWTELAKIDCPLGIDAVVSFQRVFFVGLMGLLPLPPVQAADPMAAEYQRRVDRVTSIRGFVALWDFVKRDGSGDGARFDAHQPKSSKFDFRLDPLNYVRTYWGEGREATVADFPLLGRGPFGQAIRLRNEADVNFRPCLLVPRERLHGSRLDVKGEGQSVTLIAWVIRESGNHAVAGIWHEGLHKSPTSTSVRTEQGKRQYALFGGLAANAGASAAHVSENGGASFGDRYARNLSVTPELLPTVSVDASGEELDQAWSVMGLVFDNKANTVTSYLNGKASEYWIDEPAKHPFFRWPAHAWTQDEQGGAVPGFPDDQHYRPPNAFTKVRVTSTSKRELVALRVNPFWFPHDLYTPPTETDGGPFTIGRVIHTSRNVGFTGYIGGIAVFDRALSGKDMARLANLCRTPLSL